MLFMLLIMKLSHLKEYIMSHEITDLLEQAEAQLENHEKVYIWQNARGIANNWAVSNSPSIFKEAPTLIYDNIYVAQTALIAPASR
jgi:hypothetical protein